MRFLLDTNACIAHLTGRAPRLTERMRATSPSDIALCSVVKAELLFGAHKSARSADNLSRLATFFAPFVSVPFDDDAAESCGRIRSMLEKQGTPIGPNDLLIAAIAFTHGLTVVTRNYGEFDRVPGLVVENWEAP